VSSEVPGCDPRGLSGYAWLDNGQSALSGPLLDLYRRLDGMFLSWARGWDAEDHLFPTFLPARVLAAVDYFRSFPHLATFPVALDPTDENLDAFTRQQLPDGDGRVRLTAMAPIQDVLTPAACYHFYSAFRGRTLERPQYLTTRATCFRREAYYAPLARQWSFSMREIVCLGSAEEVKRFLDTSRERLERSLRVIDLPVAWETASDPFFRPRQNPKRLAQQLDTLKTEMVFGGGLAIGSLNFHRDTFGEAFEIRREGKPAFSGCVAFGVERWMRAFLTRFGPEPSGWPALERSHRDA